MKQSVRSISLPALCLAITFVYTSSANGQSLDDYRSKTPLTGSWKDAASWERYNCSSWVNAGTYPTDANTHNITVRSGSTLSVSSALTVDDLTIDAGGTVTNSSTLTYGPTIRTLNGTLSSSGTLTMDGSAFVYGTLRNSGTVSANAYNIWIRTGGTYQHDDATTAGTIPACSWETGSTLLVTGYTSSTEELSLLVNPELENLTWNCTAQTGAIPFPSDFSSIHGTFTIASTIASRFAAEGSACFLFSFAFAVT